MIAATNVLTQIKPTKLQSSRLHIQEKHHHGGSTFLYFSGKAATSTRCTNIHMIVFVTSISSPSLHFISHRLSITSLSHGP